MRRFLVIVAVIVVLIFATGAGSLTWLALQLPQENGVAKLPGLMVKTEVFRDEKGVPHIFAANLNDAYRALGYVHAQDRFEQMELMRRAAAGRLSELAGVRFGPWATQMDRMARTLAIYAHAQKSLASLSPETRGALNAYAEGVNAWLTHRGESLPPILIALRDTPEPWKPEDSVAWGKMMALQLSGNAREEADNARLMQRLSPERRSELFGWTGAPPPADIDYKALANSLAAALSPLSSTGASNAWVVNGRRSASGMPVLANDPHLGLEAPIPWYLVRIVTPDLSLAGATAPGVPFLILGHNDHVAWGLTTNPADTQDLFVECTDPNNSARYLAPGGPLPFTTRRELIHVAGQPDWALTVKETRHGPIVDDLPMITGRSGVDRYAKPADASACTSVALSATALADDDTTADAMRRINLAQSGTDIRAALAYYVAPAQNIVFADTHGNIGMISAGRVPVRRHGDGTIPAPGASGDYDWVGFIPYAELPQTYDPPNGRIVNGNNRPIGSDYPRFLAAHWPDPVRANHIIENLDAKPIQNADTAMMLQLDAISPKARDILPVLTSMRPRSPGAADALALLQKWNGAMDRRRPEPLIYTAWINQLRQALFAKELGDLYDVVGHSIDTDVIRRALTGEIAGCRPGCGQMLAQTLDSAIDEIAQGYGGSIDRWRWGDAHQATLSHRILRRLPYIGAYFDLSTPVDGDNDTINRATPAILGRPNPEMASHPYADVHGAGFRGVYDLADLNASRFVIATGESGSPFSPHWGDFVRLWAGGGMVTLSGDPAELEARGAHQLTLAP